MNTLTLNFSKNISADRFVIGQRNGKNNLYQRILTTLLDSLRLVFQVLKMRYDLVHINPSIRPFSLLRDALFITALRLIRFNNIVVFIHGWNSKVLNELSKRSILRHLFVRIFSGASAIIVLASQFKIELIDIGFSSANIHVLTTMFSRDIFRRMPPEIRRNSPKLLFLSRIVKNKGIYELVDAFELVKTHFSDLTLIIAGDGPERKALRAYASQKYLTNSVIFTGYLRNSEKTKVLLEADIFILPTYSEGCPVSLLEAMAAGLAVITSPVGGIPDVIQHGVNGILLTDLTPPIIAAAIERLLFDRKFCESIQANNRSKAWDHYEAKIVSAKIENIYKEVAKDA